MAESRPNVVIILTDDQGWGDLGAHGNPYLRTPNLDRLHSEGPRFERFYSCPVCAPTRACLMTGRYNFRTRAIDTYLGRAMMDPEEVTLAEILRDAGYKTGLFGKWHLGDNYPMRAMDKGFDEVLGHNGGGMCQPADFEGNTYFDPMLWHNGKPEKHQGYCTDIFANAAIDFIEKHKDVPFFAYLATNAPHSPLQISDEWADPYRKMGLNDTFARVYGMIENIDYNVGKILNKLEELNIDQNTYIMFMGDNGPCGSQSYQGQVRYNGGLRNIKGTVYNGGILVPCLMRWPKELKAGFEIDRIAHFIDILPTVAAACGAKIPEGIKIDGVNLLPLMKGEVAPGNWHDRFIFTQWHRGDVPEKYRSCAVIGQQYKLINGNELYDMISDLEEKQDVASQHPDIVDLMRREYENWFDDVSSTRPDNYAPPKIYIGTPYENPVILSRQDWRVHGKDGWSDNDYGHWEILVTESRKYNVRIRFPEPDKEAVIHLKFKDMEKSQVIQNGVGWHTFEDVELVKGPNTVESWIDVNGNSKAARYIYISH